MGTIFKRFYNWAMRTAAGPRAMHAVGWTSFAESAILPIPIDAVTFPVMLADRSRIWRVVWLASWTSALGGAVGYTLGWLLYETVVTWMIDFYGWEHAFHEISEDFHEHGAIIVAVGAISPIPYKLVAIASGVERLDFLLFMVISVLGRGVRFAIFGALIWKWGDKVHYMMEHHSKLFGWGLIASLVFGFVLVSWLF